LAEVRNIPSRGVESSAKIDLIRAALRQDQLSAVSFKGLDSFAWLTAGGYGGLFVGGDHCVAEIIVTAARAVVVADSMEADRLRDEVLPDGVFDVIAFPWYQPGDRQRLVQTVVGRGAVASDRPAAGQRPLPASLDAARRVLRPDEQDRYRALGRDAAGVATRVLERSEPEWPERRLAGDAAAELLMLGIEPAAVLVAGEARQRRFRHPLPTTSTLGRRAMLVLGVRRHGLWVSLTRFVSFGPESTEERADGDVVREVESVAWATSQPGRTLGEVWSAIAEAYRVSGRPGAERDHHQGGTTGYLVRDVLGTAGATLRLDAGMAVAWNPSLQRSKIEDTALIGGDGLEVLTVDPRWPARAVGAYRRPDTLVK
jgi:Xaa-Pro aminopeptidase